jgi:2-iminobutanoate/2-iminopropanoate deaminase
MNEHVTILTPAAPAPSGSYVQARAVDGFLYTAGFGPLDPITKSVVGEDIAAQTRQVMENLKAVLGAAGLTFDDVVKTTAHLQHLKTDFHGFDEVYRGYFGDLLPARTTVGSDLFDILVEIDVVARVSA